MAAYFDLGDLQAILSDQTQRGAPPKKVSDKMRDRHLECQQPAYPARVTFIFNENPSVSQNVSRSAMRLLRQGMWNGRFHLWTRHQGHQTGDFVHYFGRIWCFTGSHASRYVMHQGDDQHTFTVLNHF